MKICVLGEPRTGTSVILRWIRDAGYASLDECLIPWHKGKVLPVTGTHLRYEDFDGFRDQPTEAIRMVPDDTVFKHFHECMSWDWYSALRNYCRVINCRRHPFEAIASRYQASKSGNWNGGQYHEKAVTLPQDWTREMMLRYEYAMPLIEACEKEPAFIQVNYHEFAPNPLKAIQRIGMRLNIQFPNEAPMEKQSQIPMKERIKNLPDVRKWVIDFPKLAEYVRSF